MKHALFALYAPLTTALCALSLTTTESSTQQPTVSPQTSTAQATATPTVDLAICLDTSGSMRGLIDSARQGIWAIVNDLALAKPTPVVRVSLLTFGNDNHNPENGWVEIATDFTSDLDLVSEKLFALTTNGGTEFVGRVVDTASKQLTWSDDPNTLKLLVVAGNESADQDQEVRYVDACKTAITSGIQINSIYCGSPHDNMAPAWKDVAVRADGQFHAINHNQAQVAIATPFDAQLNALNVSLNGTYLAFGSDAKRGFGNQACQDWNASNCNTEVMAQRVLAKSTGNYVNPTWDLCDALKAETVKLEEIPDEDLPEELRGKTLSEKVEIVELKRTSRAQMQKEIQELAKKRQAVILEEQQRRAIDPSTAFDLAVRNAVRTQAATRGIEIQNLPEVPKPQEAAPVVPAAAPLPGTPAPQVFTGFRNRQTITNPSGVVRRQSMGGSGQQLQNTVQQRIIRSPQNSGVQTVLTSTPTPQPVPQAGVSQAPASQPSTSNGQSAPAPIPCPAPSEATGQAPSEATGQAPSEATSQATANPAPAANRGETPPANPSRAPSSVLIPFHLYPGPIFPFPGGC